MSEEFKESAFKDSLILISKQKMADAVECLINKDWQSNVELKNIVLCLLQGREIENYDWLSKNQNGDTKITAIAELCRLAYALQVGKADGIIRESVEKSPINLYVIMELKSNKNLETIQIPPSQVVCGCMGLFLESGLISWLNTLIASMIKNVNCFLFGLRQALW